MTRSILAPCLACALALAACGGGGSDAPAPSAGTPTGTQLAQCTGSLSGLAYADVKPIFDAHCIGCHNGAGGGGSPAGTDFRTRAGILPHLTHVDELAAANPGGTIVNTAMPPVASGITLPQRQQLACWIAGGAP